MKNNILIRSVVILLFTYSGNLQCAPAQDQLLKSSVSASGHLLNVIDFGAKGDGRTDDTNALQSAINQGGGKTIFFPKGNYAISGSLYLVSGVELLGEGDAGGVAGSSILPVKNSSRNFAAFSTKSSELSDVIFRNIRTLKTKYSLSMNVKGGYLTKIKWYNCVFQEHEIGINIFGSNTSGMYANMIRDSYFKSSKLGIYCQGPFNINIIQGTGFENMTDGYIKLDNGSVSNLSNSFIENRCESVSNSNGVAIELAKDVFGFYINRNFFENSFKTILKTNGARNVDFSNNIYTNNDPKKYGSIMINGGDATIKNNSFLTGVILDITNGGFCSELTSNSFLNFSDKVFRDNLGVVINQYNKKYNNHQQ